MLRYAIAAFLCLLVPIAHGQITPRPAQPIAPAEVERVRAAIKAGDPKALDMFNALVPFLAAQEALQRGELVLTQRWIHEWCGAAPGCATPAKP